MRHLTVQDVADHLNMHRSTIYRWVTDGRIPGFYKVGRMWRITEDDFLKWVKEMQKDTGVA